MSTPPDSPPPPSSSRRIGIAAAIWAASMLLSRVIGLVREAIIGRTLGGGTAADVYFAAFQLPNWFLYLLAGGALSIVFIPIFNAHLEADDEEGAWRAFSQVVNFELVLLAVTLPALWLGAPWFLPIVAPGFSGPEAVDLIALTRILMPAQAFHLVGALLSATLQARDKHTFPAIAPLIYTLCVIAGGLIGGHDGGAYGFAWGVFVGSAVGPFGMPLVGCLLTGGIKWRPVLSLRDPDLTQYLWRTLPVMLAFSIVGMDDLVLRREGSLVGEGAIATLQYAKTLMQVPIGVFGLATGVAAYPTITRLVAQGNDAEAYATLAGVTRRVLVLAFASQVGLTCAGAAIAEVIYGSRIQPAQYAQIGVALGLLSLALWAWAAQTVVVRGYYAKGSNWLPSLMGTAILVAFLPIYHALGAHWGTAGLAVASSAGVTLYVILLIVLLRRWFPGGVDGYPAFFARAVPATAVGIAVGLLVDHWLPIGVPLIHGAISGGVGVAVFVAAALAFGLRDVADVLELLAGRVRARLTASRGRPG